MRNSVEIDSAHSRAIVREIGHRLRVAIVRRDSLPQEDRELPRRLRLQLERLRQLDDHAQTTATGFFANSAQQRRK
jgi:hypothetical protein